METKTFARLFDGLAAAPWVHGSLPHAVPFSRRVHGRMLVWPRDMDAFAGGTIPAADLPPDEVTATTATAWIKHRLLPDDGFYLELAHGAIDRQGRVDVLLPMDRPAGCFGTLVVFPSSTCMGGAITVAHENRTTVFTPPAGASSFLAFYNSCTVNVSPLVGTRAILIYHVVYLGPTDRDRFVPIAAAPLIARLKKAAASANQDSAVYAFKWRTRYGPELDFSALEPHDTAIVDALCATEAYDVALVRVTVQGGPANAVDVSEEQMGLELMTQSFEEADERYEIVSEVQHTAGIAFVRMGFAGPAITIVSALYHPACNVPAEVSLAKIQLTDFVGSRTMVVLARGGSPFLIFWPKRHRARLLGFERCMQLLWSSVADGCNMNSIDATVSCMARGAMEMLLAGRHALPGLQRAEPDSHQMCSFLADLGDAALIAAFINRYANVKKHASWLFDMLDRLGWEALRVAVLWRLRSSRLEEALSFLGTLIEDNQLRLRQPFAVEFLKEMWATVRPTSFFQLACIEACPATLVHGLRIESCIVSASNDNVVGPYLRLCLPNSLIAHIDAFLYPATLLDIVTATPHVFDPVEVVAKAIVQLCNEELSVSLRPWGNLNMQSVRSEIEGALDAMRQCLGLPWTFSRLPSRSSRPRLGARGVDDWLTFPLPNAAQLLVEHPDGRIPLSHLYIEHDEPDVIALSDIMGAIDAALAPPSMYQAYLSHVAIDVIGSASILAPIDPPSGSFATLWVELPSSYVGGETTLTHEGSSMPTQLWPREYDLAAAYNDVDVVVAPIVSGHRVLLVFSLAVDECTAAVRTAPLSISAGIARLAATAALPGATARMWGCPLNHPVSALEWRQVTASDKIVAIALCASGVYDVALVEHAPYNAEDDDDDHDDGRAPTAWSVRLAGGVLFPKTLADPSLADDLGNKTVAIPPRARFSLAFWASSQRAHVAGHRVTSVAVYRFLMTQTTWHARDAYLGFPTGNALLLAYFEMFGSRPFVDTVHHERYRDTSSLCDLLLQQRRLDLVQCFLQDHCVYFKDCAHDYASLIHSVLTIYGWEVLAPTMDVLLTKWPLGGAMRLVASLAGAALDPVCPPLQRPFAKEFIKTCFCRLLVAASTAMDADFAFFRHGTLGLQQLLIDVLLLQTYLTTPSESAAGSYLDAFLPAPLVHLVDTFLIPLSFVDAVVLKQRSIFDPVAVVGPAVRTLSQHVPSATLAPLVAPLLASAHELPDAMSIDGLIAYLCLVPNLDMDLVTAIATRYPLLFVPTMLAVAKDHRDALDVMAIGAMVIALSDRIFEDATFVTLESFLFSGLSEHHEHYSAWYPDVSKVDVCIMGVLADATTFLDAYVPSKLMDHATSWTDALCRSSKRDEFFTSCVFRLLFSIEDICIRRSDVGIFLAKTCRTELQASSTRRSAILRPLPSVAMAIDVSKDCASCADFAAFLCNAKARRYATKGYATTGSPALCAHVRALAVPAHGLRFEDPRSAFGTLYIDKHPPGIDVVAWDALEKEHQTFASLASRMGLMTKAIAAWASHHATPFGD